MAQSQRATLAQLQQSGGTSTLPPRAEGGHSLTDMSIEPVDEPSQEFTPMDSILMDELTTLREKCAAQESTIESLIRQADASITSLLADKAQLESQLIALEDDLRAALLSQETAIAKAATFESRTFALLNKVEELTTSATLASERVKTLENASREDSIRLQKLEEANARLEEDNAELRIHVSSLETEVVLCRRTPLKSPRKMPSSARKEGGVPESPTPRRMPGSMGAGVGGRGKTPLGATRVTRRSDSVFRPTGDSRSAAKPKPAAETASSETDAPTPTPTQEERNARPTPATSSSASKAGALDSATRTRTMGKLFPQPPPRAAADRARRRTAHVRPSLE